MKHVTVASRSVAILGTVILCLAMLSLAGCSLLQRNTPPAPAPKPAPVPTPAPVTPPAPSPTPKPAEISVDKYFPALAGAEWKYKGEGNEFAQFTRNATYRSGNKAQIEDASGANVVSVYVISQTEVKRVFRVAEDDQKRNRLNDKENISEVILRAPLKTGETWQGGGVTYAIEAVGQTVTVPAGTYKDVVTVKITQPNSKWVTRDSYAPNVGLIKRDSTDGTYTVSSLLESYKPGRQP